MEGGVDIQNQPLCLSTKPQGLYLRTNEQFTKPDSISGAKFEFHKSKVLSPNDSHDFKQVDSSIKNKQSQFKSLERARQSQCEERRLLESSPCKKQKLHSHLSDKAIMKYDSKAGIYSLYTT